MSAHGKRTIICVIGRTGYGKSQFVKDMVNDLDRCVIFDVLGEYDEQFEHFQVFTSFDAFREYAIQYHNNVIFRCILRLPDISEYSAAFSVCYNIANMTMVVEEISQFCSSHYTVPSLEDLIRFGRHKSINLIAVTQRFLDLALLLRNNLDVLVAFQTPAKNDIDHLSEYGYIGNDAEQVASLPPYDYIIFDNTG